MTSSARVRRYRERTAAGRAVLKLEANEDELASVLVASGLLDLDRVDDRAAVADAMARQLQILGWLSRHHPGLLVLLRRAAGC